MTSGKWKFKNTDIEILMKNILNKLGVSFMSQYYIKSLRVIVDFFLLDYNIIIECDGDFWHKLAGRPQKDADRDLRASFSGYITLRFWGSDIKSNPQKCLNKIKKTIIN